MIKLYRKRLHSSPQPPLRPVSIDSVDKMGFNVVYDALHTIFPEIDPRVLKAVALENRNDADAAVEVVLTKVLPCMNARSRSSSSPRNSRTNVQSPHGSEMDANGGQQNVVLKNATCSDEEQPGQFYDAECDHDQLLDDENDAIHQSSGDGRVNNLLMTEYDQTEVPVSADVNVSHSSPIRETETDLNNENFLGPEFEDKLTSVDSPENMPLLNQFGLERQNSGSFNSLHVEDSHSSWCSDGSESQVRTSKFTLLPARHPEGSSVHSRTEVPNSDLVKEQPNSPKSASGELDSTSSLVVVENVSTSNAGLSRPAQICSTDVLEDDIALERNKKKTLFTALQSVINLMKEVELEEGVIEQAKKEAANGGLETLQKVESLKEMLQHAKEANEMHAGEVNGEKAILATEVKELHTRLVSLSDETDRSLAILNEMHQSLEARLVAANKEREAAEKEKLEKEAIAKKALADQDLIMERVVQEANILKAQADENAKLRDFLVERGHVVDALQGEISVICQDVILLKKQFDERLPLSKSLTSSQTSCILASSSSSMKNVAIPDLLDSGAVDPVASFEETRGMGGSSFTDELSSSETEAIDDHRKVASDDGWEIFDI